MDSPSLVDEDHILILTGNCPGFTPEKSTAFVYSASRVARVNSPLEMLNLQLKSKRNEIAVCNNTHTSKIACTTHSFFSAEHFLANATFIDFKKDEMLYTDGCSHFEIYHGNGAGGGKLKALRWNGSV